MSVLDTNLLEVDISRPLLTKPVVRLKVVEMVEKENNAKTGTNIVTTFETVFKEEAKTEKGTTTVEPGYKLTVYTGLSVTEKRTEENIRKDLKRLRMGITGQEGGAFAPLDQYIGKEVDAKLKIEKDDQYGEQNRVGQLTPAK